MPQGLRFDASPPSDRIAEWLLLLVKLPGAAAKPAGVVLLDVISDQHYTANARELPVAKVQCYFPLQGLKAPVANVLPASTVPTACAHPDSPCLPTETVVDLPCVASSCPIVPPS